MSNLSKTIVSAGWPDSRAGMVLLAVAGSIFLAVCARLQVPMWPVPMTMQSFGVMALALAFGSRLAAGSVGLYLVQGALGLPVFASGGGIVQFLGPTGGYLIGFLAMAWLVGALADRGWSRTVPTALAATLAGGLLLYLCGGIWLAMLIGPEAALVQGVLPFLLGDLLKALLAALVVPALWRMLAAAR
jgi:biotin transport system substrate-specific component